jgi:hypothetical protein
MARTAVQVEDSRELIDKTLDRKYWKPGKGRIWTEVC